jgi:squalene-hopene/tetraprenyl-beta-curcumene cyclase
MLRHVVDPSKRGSPFRRGLARRLQGSTKRALAFLFKHQTTEGARWGRWGVNYIYGTTNVLRSLATFYNDKEVAIVALRAVL